MTTLLITFSLSCALCLALTPIARALASQWGLVDRPDGRRKLHGKAIPVAGGLALLVSLWGALAVAFLVPNPLQDQLAGQTPNLTALFLASVVICLVGVADDFGLLRGRHKLIGQFLAVLIVIQSGLVVRHIRLLDWNLELGLLAVPFTVCWLLGAINSLNLIDGLDGLLSSVGLIISLAVAAMAVLMGRWDVACVAVALAGSLGGFLRYNFPPATIFLGDCGSMLIGLVVGTLAIQGSLKAPATIALAGPTALFTIPFFDTAAAIVRRKLTGRSIYTTDRGHLHHCLLRHGFSNRRVLFWVSFFCLLTVCGALASLTLQSEFFAILSALTVVGVLISSHLFGHAEFLLLKERLFSVAASLLHGRTEGQAHQMAVRLQGCAEWNELWNRLTACARELNLVMVRFNVNAPALYEGYHARWDCIYKEAEESNLWRAEVPVILGGQIVGRLEIRGQPDDQPVSMKIDTLVKLMDSFQSFVSDLPGPGPDLEAERVPGEADLGELSLRGLKRVARFVENASEVPTEPARHRGNGAGDPGFEKS